MFNQTAIFIQRRSLLKEAMGATFADLGVLSFENIKCVNHLRVFGSFSPWRWSWKLVLWQGVLTSSATALTTGSCKSLRRGMTPRLSCGSLGHLHILSEKSLAHFLQLLHHLKLRDGHLCGEVYCNFQTFSARHGGKLNRHLMFKSSSYCRQKVGELSHNHPDGKTPCVECSLLADWAKSCNCIAI